VLHWTVDLTARATAIVATLPPTFIRFRELTSARGHALLQLFLPVHDDIDWLVVVGRIDEEPLPPRRQDALAKSGSNLGYDQPPP
jgi:hypothetical protein